MKKICVFRNEIDTTLTIKSSLCGMKRNEIEHLKMTFKITSPHWVSFQWAIDWSIKVLKWWHCWFFSLTVCWTFQATCSIFYRNYIWIMYCINSHKNWVCVAPLKINSNKYTRQCCYSFAEWIRAIEPTAAPTGIFKFSTNKNQEICLNKIILEQK